MLKRFHADLKDTKQFKDVPVQNQSGDHQLAFDKTRKKFIDALLNGFNKRFEPASLVLKCSGFLQPSKWAHLSGAENNGRLKLFGNSEIRDLAAKFKMNDILLVREFGDFKAGKGMGPTLQLLIDKLNVLPVSTAECERGFSAMNLVWCDERNRLHAETVEGTFSMN